MKPYGPNTNKGLQMFKPHNTVRTLKEYKERISRRFDSAHRIGRYHHNYKKGLDNTMRSFILPDNRNSWLKKDSARRQNLLRKTLVNQPIVEPDCMAWRQFEVPYKSYSWELGKRPVPKKNMSDLTNIDYSIKYKTQISKHKPEKYLEHYVKKGETSYKDFDNFYKKEAHKIKHAFKTTPETFRGYNKIITEPYQLRDLDKLGMSKRLMSQKTIKHSKNLPERPIVKVPYTTHDNRSILAWTPVKIREGKQIGTIPRIQRGSYTVIPGKDKTQIKSSKPITHEIKYMPKSLDKYVGIGAIYRARFGNRM
jgi:hypothetical protein